LRLRRRKRSGTGALLLSILTVLFIFLSYRTGNLLFEFDSIVSFLAALVLLFRDTTHSVQARVVNRILTSSHQLVADLSAYGLGGSSFLYVPEGRRVGDVMLVPQRAGEAITPDPLPEEGDTSPSPSSDEGDTSPSPPSDKADTSPSPPPDEGEGGIPTFSLGPTTPYQAEVADSASRSTESAPSGSEVIKDAQDDSQGSTPSGSDGEQKATTTVSNLKFAPPGRAMAELFLRESALRDPTIDDIIAVIPETIVDGFQLADSCSVVVGSSDDAIEVKLVHPVLTGGCGPTKSEGTGVVGCEVCSMLAVLLSSSASRVVSLGGCTRNEKSDTSTMSLHLGAKYPSD
ncbi:MAG: hypothetical protein ACRD6W_15390, partial [Nitrososphaerales archaeon]